jgi:acyl-CoA thioesterase FadM
MDASERVCAGQRRVAPSPSFHWSAVFRWAEQAEHALMRSLGRDRDDSGRYPRRHAEAAYQHALHFDDEFDLAIQ